jgi:hypothetical protein
VRLFILVRLDVDAIAVFAPDEGAALMRSVVHGFGWGIGHEIAHSVFGHGRSRKSRRLTRRTQRRVSARARASGIHQNWQGLMRTIQVAEPRQMCWLPYTADMIRSGWNLWAGSASRPANSLAVSVPQDSRRQGSFAMGSARDQNHREAEM